MITENIDVQCSWYQYRHVHIWIELDLNKSGSVHLSIVMRFHLWSPKFFSWSTHKTCTGSEPRQDLIWDINHLTRVLLVWLISVSIRISPEIHAACKVNPTIQWNKLICESVSIISFPWSGNCTSKMFVPKRQRHSVCSNVAYQMCIRCKKKKKRKEDIVLVSCS